MGPVQEGPGNPYNFYNFYNFYIWQNLAITLIIHTVFFITKYTVHILKQT